MSDTPINRESGDMHSRSVCGWHVWLPSLVWADGAVEGVDCEKNM